MTDARQEERTKRIVAALRREAGYVAVEHNYDGDLKPEETLYWLAADLIENGIREGMERAARIAHVFPTSCPLMPNVVQVSDGIAAAIREAAKGKPNE